MKRLLLSILVVFYVIVTSGITMSFHYCKGELADLEWGVMENTCPSCGQKQKSSHCCSTEAHFIKLIVDQNTEHLPEMDFSPVVLSLLSNEWGDLFVPDTKERLNADSSVSPSFRRKEVPLFIYHCLLLI